jgi:ion channel
MMSLGNHFHGEVIVGFGASLTNIALHAVMMAVLVWTAHRASIITRTANPRLRLIVVMWATVSVLMIAHMSEVIVWASTYELLDAVPRDADAIYFAFVNYTTLGYGDVIPAARWRLLGPLTAMNGVLLFGWSTAVIYDILRTVVNVIPMTGAAVRDR